MRRSLEVFRDNPEYNSIIYVKAPSRAKAKELLLKLHNGGYKWGAEASLLENDGWDKFKELTFYAINPNNKDVIIGKYTHPDGRFRKTLKCVGL